MNLARSDSPSGSPRVSASVGRKREFTLALQTIEPRLMLALLTFWFVAMPFLPDHDQHATVMSVLMAGILGVAIVACGIIDLRRAGKVTVDLDARNITLHQRFRGRSQAWSLDGITRVEVRRVVLFPTVIVHLPGARLRLRVRKACVGDLERALDPTLGNARPLHRPERTTVAP